MIIILYYQLSILFESLILIYPRCLIDAKNRFEQSWNSMLSARNLKKWSKRCDIFTTLIANPSSTEIPREIISAKIWIISTCHMCKVEQYLIPDKFHNKLMQTQHYDIIYIFICTIICLSIQLIIHDSKSKRYFQQAKVNLKLLQIVKTGKHASLDDECRRLTSCRVRCADS